jgi:hypothetical protein
VRPPPCSGAASTNGSRKVPCAFIEDVFGGGMDIDPTSLLCAQALGPMLAKVWAPNGSRICGSITDWGFWVVIEPLGSARLL